MTLEHEMRGAAAAHGYHAEVFVLGREAWRQLLAAVGSYSLVQDSPVGATNRFCGITTVLTDYADPDRVELHCRGPDGQPIIHVLRQ